MLEYDANYAVVVASGDVKLSLVGLVWVHQELRLSRVFFLIFLFGVFFRATSEYVSTPVRLPKKRAIRPRATKRISGPLLGGKAGRHVGTHHAILFVNGFVEADKNTFFGTDLKLATFEAFEVVDDAVGHGDLEVVAELLHFLQINLLIIRFKKRLLTKFICLPQAYIYRMIP